MMYVRERSRTISFQWLFEEYVSAVRDGPWFMIHDDDDDDVMMVGKDMVFKWGTPGVHWRI